jgi:hypothetical protein
MIDVKRRDALLAIVAGTASLADVAEAAPTIRKKARITASKADYSSQKRVRGLSLPHRVSVIGTGGFGCWPAIISAMSGIAEIDLIDASNVDQLDLARSPFRPSDIGRPKAQALAEIIQLLRPELDVSWRKRFVNPGENDVFAAPVIFDGTNSSELGRYLANECKRRSIKYVQGFYNGMAVGTTQTHVDGLTFKRGEPVPVWGGAAMLAGAMAAASAFGEPITFFGEPQTFSSQNILSSGLSYADK